MTKVGHTCAPGEARRGCDGTSDWISSILEEKVASQFDYGPKQAAIDLKSFRDVAVPKKTVESGESQGEGPRVDGRAVRPDSTVPHRPPTAQQPDVLEHREER